MEWDAGTTAAMIAETTVETGARTGGTAGSEVDLGPPAVAELR